MLGTREFVAVFARFSGIVHDCGVRADAKGIGAAKGASPAAAEDAPIVMAQQSKTNRRREVRYIIAC
jgi:hypothetical protein